MAARRRRGAQAPRFSVMSMTDARREKRTSEELKAASDRLFYEWQMLDRIARVLEEGVDDQLIENVFIESGAVHSRNLADFFYGYEQKQQGKKKGRVRRDDMVAEDFFEEPGDWWEARGKLPDALGYDDLDFYVNKQVVHMVYPQRERKRWNFAKIADRLQPALETFIERLDEEQVGDRWKGLVERPEDSLVPRWQRLRSLIQAKVQSSS